MSRVVFADHGIPMPIPQLEVLDGLGRFVARSDFGWEEERTLGEFDGKQKYGRLLLRPVSHPRMRCSRRSAGRTGYVTWVGRSSAGSGPSSSNPPR